MRKTEAARAHMTSASFLLMTTLVSSSLSLGADAALGAADALKIQLVTRVPEGQLPRIKLTANEPVDAITVDLARDDGQAVLTTLPAVSRGGSQEVRLDGKPGTHRYNGRLRIKRGNNTSETELAFETVVSPPLKIEIDKSRVDLALRQLELKLTRPAQKVSIKVYGVDGGKVPLVQDEQDFAGRAAGEPLVVTWPAMATGGPDAIGHIALHVTDVDGFFTDLSLFPWSVFIPHEEVQFAVDEANVAPSEKSKLEASFKKISDALAKHRSIGRVSLYIAGHTDSQGSTAYNLTLSQRRAQAIATWFRRRGLTLPIAFEGFGEHAPLVVTADETDEPRNRRVDYILALEAPALKTTAFVAAWKNVR